MDNVAVGMAFLYELQSSYDSIIQWMLRTYISIIYHKFYIILAPGSVVKYNTFVSLPYIYPAPSHDYGQVILVKEIVHKKWLPLKVNQT